MNKNKLSGNNLKKARNSKGMTREQVAFAVVLSKIYNELGLVEQIQPFIFSQDIKSFKNTGSVF